MAHLLKPIMLGILTSLFAVACTGKTANNLTHQQNQSATSPSATPSECQTIQHNLGETQICGQPQKVVVLGPNLLELLLTLEVQPVGYADYFPLPYHEFDQPGQQIPYLGERVTSQPTNVGTWSAPSLEAIAKLKPDLILGTIEANQKEYPLLSQIAPTLLLNYAPDKGWEQQLREIANILQRSQQAEEMIAAHEQRLAAVGKEFKSITNVYPKVLLLAFDQLDQNLQIESSNNFCGSLIEELGFQLVSLPSSEKSQQTSNLVSLEVLPQLDADLIIVQGRDKDFSNPAKDPVNHQLKNVKQQWNNNEIAQSMRASKEGRVYFTTAYLCRALPGPIGTEIFLEQLRQMLLDPQ
ncbi:MAG: iron-siderophore ABC transporter substrate-binding protein [Moorea sp. SIO2I5]|nr:iron-siderophore ABC transporter substrate-binding protein [Moorena sp. SIO2I5]